MSNCSCDAKGSTLNRQKIQSKYPIASQIVDAAASPAYSKVMGVPQAAEVLFQIINAGDAGAIVTSFRLESFGEYDADGNKLKIDSAGELVVAESIDPDTGIGATIVDLETLEACLVKERIGNCGQTPSADGQLVDDTGAIGNVYNLELQIAEIGSVAERCGCVDPCFVRVCIETAAPTVFTLLKIEYGQHYSQGIVNYETVK